MSAPLVIPPALYWRWKWAEAQQRAVEARAQHTATLARQQQAEAQRIFDDATDVIARTVPGFNRDGTYQTDDTSCTVTEVAP